MLGIRQSHRAGMGGSHLELSNLTLADRFTLQQSTSCNPWGNRRIPPAKSGGQPGTPDRNGYTWAGCGSRRRKIRSTHGSRSSGVVIAAYARWRSSGAVARRDALPPPDVDGAQPRLGRCKILQRIVGHANEARAPRLCPAFDHLKSRRMRLANPDPKRPVQTVSQMLSRMRASCRRQEWPAALRPLVRFKARTTPLLRAGIST